MRAVEQKLSKATEEENKAQPQSIPESKMPSSSSAVKPVLTQKTFQSQTTKSSTPPSPTTSTTTPTPSLIHPPKDLLPAPTTFPPPPYKPNQLLAQGAESQLHYILFFNKPSLYKHRFPKTYRHPLLDTRLTSRRLNNEARSILRCHKAGIRVPALYWVDIENNGMVFEFVEGIVLRDWLKAEREWGEVVGVAERVGKVLGRLHDVDIVHGDLTTSNMIVEKSEEGEDGGICLIDFGLSSQNGTEEEKAVDLYVLERAVLSAHGDNAERINNVFWKEYEKTSRKGKQVLQRLDQVRMRGRKRDMVG